MLRFRRKIALIITVSLMLMIAPFSSPMAHAATDHLVINEVYVKAGYSDSITIDKYVELYNPTGQEINLSGKSLQYFGKKSTGSNPQVLNLEGTIAANGYFLIAAGKGKAGEPLKNVDQTANFQIGVKGALALVQSTDKITITVGQKFPDTVIDLVGWGEHVIHEGAEAAPAMHSTNAISRTDSIDTDNNGADFTKQTPSPMSSKGDAKPETGGGNPPTPPPAPTTEKTIAEIQGEGDSTPFAGQKVITTGVVTAAYPKGGFNGFYMETPGTSDAKHSEKASDGIFVYVGKNGLANMPEIGKCVKVTGTAGEYHGLTQISPENIEPKSDCQPVEPLTLAAWPKTDADREKLEGMLVLPQGDYTITNNYQLNKYGSIDLVQGDQPLAQSTDVVAPGPEAQAYEAANKQKLVTLDDGSSFSFDISKSPKAGNNPLPWITKEHTARAGAHVTFDKPVIVDYRFQWNFQPTSQQVGIEYMPVTIEQNRPAAPEQVNGDIKLGTFNVLNYFTDLGENEPGCNGYKDREGNQITANKCQVRGAYRQADFERQQAKIVNAINGLGADVVSLEEIENPHTANGAPDLANRDVPLSKLVEALNAKAGAGTWNYVKSPKEVPNNGDAIRVAFIYKPAKVKPVGESKILDNKYFTGVARSPLAQEFAPVVDPTKQEVISNFTVIVNHFKSKGSVANFPGMDNNDKGDGQGNNNILRTEQAKALADWTKTFSGPLFLLGDFNAYGKEDPVTTLEKAGFQDVEAKFPPAQPHYSYQYGGRMGSLDHVLANSAAVGLVTGATVWEINAQEPVSYEYSRYNYNVTDLWNDSPYRSSDHNPALIGLNVIKDKPTPASPGNNPLAKTGVESMQLLLLAAFLSIAGGITIIIRTRYRRA